MGTISAEWIRHEPNTSDFMRVGAIAMSNWEMRTLPTSCVHLLLVIMVYIINIYKLIINLDSMYVGTYVCIHLSAYPSFSVPLSLCIFSVSVCLLCLCLSLVRCLCAAIDFSTEWPSAKLMVSWSVSQLAWPFVIAGIIYAERNGRVQPKGRTDTTKGTDI